MNIYKLLASLVTTGTGFLGLRPLATLILLSRFVERKRKSVTTAFNKLERRLLSNALFFSLKATSDGVF